MIVAELVVVTFVSNHVPVHYARELLIYSRIIFRFLTLTAKVQLARATIISSLMFFCVPQYPLVDYSAMDNAHTPACSRQILC